MKTYIILLCAAVCILASCKSTTAPDSGGGTSSAKLSLSELAGLPSTGGLVSGVGFASDGSMLAVIDKKIYKASIGGSVLTLVNDEAVHSDLAVAPDGSVYTTVVVNGTAGIRRYDASLSSFASLLLPNTPQGGVPITYRFAPNGDVYICYADQHSVYYDLFYSADKGSTWTLLHPQYGQSDVAFLPNGDIISTSDAPSGAAVITSSDHGVTWNTISKAPVNSLGQTIFLASNGDIYNYSQGDNKIRVSHDGGKTFIALPWPSSNAYIRNLSEMNGKLYIMGGASGSQPDQSNSASGVVSSSDGGQTWKQEFICADAVTMTVKNNTIVLGSGHGLIYNTSVGWITLGTGTVTSLKSIALDKNGNILLGAEKGFYRKQGSTWYSLAFPGGVGKLAVASDGSIAAACGLAIICSSDNGASWTYSSFDSKGVIFIGVPSVSAVAAVGNIFVATVCDYVDRIQDYGAGFVMRSNDGGKTFQTVSTPGSITTLINNGSTTLYGIKQYELAGHNADALTSTDQGASWQSYTGKYFPLCFNSHHQFLHRNTSQGTDLTFDLVTEGSNDLKTFSTGYDGSHAFIADILFASDGKFYTIINDAVLAKQAIYKSDSAPQ